MELTLCTRRKARTSADRFNSLQGIFEKPRVFSSRHQGPASRRNGLGIREHAPDFSSFPADGRHPAELIDNTDQAMHAAKARS
jgi:hypothetical protein